MNILSRIRIYFITLMNLIFLNCVYLSKFSFINLLILISNFILILTTLEEELLIRMTYVSVNSNIMKICRAKINSKKGHYNVGKANHIKTYNFISIKSRDLLDFSSLISTF